MDDEVKVTEVPTTLSQEHWNHWFDADDLADPIVQNLRNAHSNAEMAWRATLIAHKKQMAVEYNTLLTNMKLSAQQADRRQTEACRLLDSAKERAERELGFMKESVARSLQEANTGHADAIRKHVKGLKPTERIGFITGRMKLGDYSAVAAVLTAPSYLSDLSDSEHDMLHQVYEQNRFPQAVYRRKAIEKGIELVKNGGTSLIEVTHRLVDRAALRDADTKAAAARDAAD